MWLHLLNQIYLIDRQQWSGTGLCQCSHERWVNMTFTFKKSRHVLFYRLSLSHLFSSSTFVVNGDIQPPQTVSHPDRTAFVKCDVTSWEDQVEVFRVAREKAPNGRIDVVIANAGIYGPDVLDGLDDDAPQKPVTKLLDVNLVGVLYTSKLAGWHFHHGTTSESSDQCLILVSSIMGYIDTQGSSIYSATKHGVRGIMTCLRRKGLVRVNCLAPWFIATPIMPKSFIESTGAQFRAKGVDFATTDDAVTAMARLATDTFINGKHSDPETCPLIIKLNLQLFDRTNTGNRAAPAVAIRLHGPRERRL